MLLVTVTIVLLNGSEGFTIILKCGENINKEWKSDPMNLQ